MDKKYHCIYTHKIIGSIRHEDDTDYVIWWGKHAILGKIGSGRRSSSLNMFALCRAKYSDGIVCEEEILVI